MKKVVYSFIVLSFGIFLFSCQNNKVDNSISKIRFINASSVSGDINVFIDYKKVFATDIQYLNYSLFSQHISTIHTLQIKGSGGNMIKDTALDMKLNKTYTAILYDQSNMVRFKIIEEDFITPIGSNCKIRFLHLSNNAPATDVTSGLDSNVLFRNYSNGDFSEYKVFGIDSTYFNAHNTGSTAPYYSMPRYQQLKAGHFYTMFLKGNMGSTGIDSLGFYAIENNGNY